MNDDEIIELSCFNDEHDSVCGICLDTKQTKNLITNMGFINVKQKISKIFQEKNFSRDFFNFTFQLSLNLKN